MLFALIFGLGGAALLLLFDWSLARFSQGEMRQALIHQMEIMRADADLEGGEALVNVLREHERSSRTQRYAFLVVTADGAVYSNGLSERVRDIDGFGRFDGGPETDNRPADMLVFTQHARDGSFLAVGRGTMPLDDLRRGLGSMGLWAGLGIVGLAVAGGFGVGLVVLRSLDRVNISVARIVDGQASERLPAMGFGAEFDQLAISLNHMLERQEATIKALRQVSEDVAHDLRTPLNRVRNRLEGMGKALPENFQEPTDRALAELDEAMALLNALLDLAQIEGGAAPRNFSLMSVGDIVTPIVEAYRPLVEEAGGVFQTLGPLDLPLFGDAVLLKQAISNLLENALLHSPPGVSVTLQVEQDEHDLIVIVTDDGPGIPADERVRVVQRLYRMDRSRTVPGSGLGLPLSAAVAQLHHGTLAIASAPKGAQVRITIPHAPGVCSLTSPSGKMAIGPQ